MEFRLSAPLDGQARIVHKEDHDETYDEQRDHDKRKSIQNLICTKWLRGLEFKPQKKILQRTILQDFLKPLIG